MQKLNSAKNIYMIGPGGVGKTTTGPILAAKLGMSFIDLDDEFCLRILNIGHFLKAYDYAKYVAANSELFFNLTSELDRPHVIALSSGFLIHKTHEKIIEKNIQAVRSTGLSIMISPSKDNRISSEIVAARQITRGFGLNYPTEQAKFLNRIDTYKSLSDIQVYSIDTPEKITSLIVEKMAKRERNI